jgi:hypothetical protein
MRERGEREMRGRRLDVKFQAIFPQLEWLLGDRILIFFVVLSPLRGRRQRGENLFRAIDIKFATL